MKFRPLQQRAFLITAAILAPLLCGPAPALGQNLPENLLETLRPEHPRLILPDHRIGDVRGDVRLHRLARKFYKKVRARGEELLEETPVEYLIPDGLRLLRQRASHSHLDLGTFVLDAFAKRWAIDLGSDDYNLPGYFGKKRWTYYRLRTEGHNTLTINGENQDAAAKAPILEFDCSREEAFATAELTAAYAKHARKVHRTVRRRGAEEIVIEDLIEAKKPVEVVWQLHTPAEVVISGRTAVLTQGGIALRMEVLEPSNAVLEVHEVEVPSPQKPISGIRKLLVRFEEKVESLRLVVRFSGPR